MGASTPGSLLHAGEPPHAAVDGVGEPLFSGDPGTISTGSNYALYVADWHIPAGISKSVFVVRVVDAAARRPDPATGNLARLETKRSAGLVAVQRPGGPFLYAIYYWLCAG